MNSETNTFMKPFYEDLPNYWSKKQDFSNKLYTKPNISYYQLIEECNNQSFIQEISRWKPDSIERLENPFMFGRYQVRKEYLIWTNQSEDIKENFLYHPLASEDVPIVAEYGCDHRRYRTLTAFNQKNGKNPNFYSSLTEIRNIKQHNQNVIVVARVLSIGSNINKPYYENDYYPQYFLYY